ncbi:MAG: hypothetical protein WKG07_37425 [Hymenobacter sp.]
MPTGPYTPRSCRRWFSVASWVAVGAAGSVPGALKVVYIPPT